MFTVQITHLIQAFRMHFPEFQNAETQSIWSTISLILSETLLKEWHVLKQCTQSETGETTSLRPVGPYVPHDGLCVSAVLHHCYWIMMPYCNSWVTHLVKAIRQGKKKCRFPTFWFWFWSSAVTVIHLLWDRCFWASITKTITLSSFR